MRMKSIFKVLLLLPLLSACQSEKTSLEEPEVPVKPKHVYTVKASLPGNEQTRTHVTYGNTDPDWEIFQWHPINEEHPDQNDYISIFNISRLTDPQCCDGIDLGAIAVKGNTAVFQTIEVAKEEADEVPGLQVPKFYVNAGDLLLVNYWSTDKTYDGSGIFTIDISQPAPQIIYDSNNVSNMTWMQGNLKMYDIVTAEKDDEIPDVHFRHLSAIMRITLRNETGEKFVPKTLEFTSEGEGEGEQYPFFTELCFSVDPAAENGTGLKVYEEGNDDGSGSFSTYTNKVSCSINNYTAAEGAEKGTFISEGESYDLYLSLVPRIKNTIVSKRLKIRLECRTTSDKSNWFDMTIDNFNTVIEAGARYWFNLTAVEEKGENGENSEYKLVFTNQWLKDHSQQTPETGE